MGKKWTKEEIQFLKFAYPNKDFTINEIAIELNRNLSSIYTKAKCLGLIRYKEILPENHKRCYKCKTILNLQCFTRRNDKYDSWCKECYKSYKKKKKYKIREEKICEEKIREKKCSRCKKVKNINEFYKLKRSSDGYNGICKQCKKETNDKSKEKN